MNASHPKNGVFTRVFALIMVGILLSGCSAEWHESKIPVRNSAVSSASTAESENSTYNTTTQTMASESIEAFKQPSSQLLSKQKKTRTTVTATTTTSAVTTASTTSTTSATSTTRATTTTPTTTPTMTTTATTIQTTTTTGSATTTTVPPTTQPPIGKYVVGYYASWSAYSGYTPDKIAVSKLTHINYAFAKIDSALKVAIADSAVDLTNFQTLRNVKSKNPSIKTLISIGGWDYSTYFSDAAATVASREVFAQSCLDFIVMYGFDGVDLDWEYPVSGGMTGIHNRAEDKQNFAYLLQAIRAKFNAQSQKDGKTYTLTIAGGASRTYINNIEPTRVAGIVDYIFIMAYDLHGPWDAYADFNAPLYSPTETSPQYKISVSDAVNFYVAAGVSSSKLVLGMPFYGYRYTVTSSINNGLFSPFTSAKSISYDTIVSTYLSNASYQPYFHSVSRIPYLFGNGTFISYDNPASIAEKVKLAKSRNLAGVGAWELSQDKSNALLNSTYNAMNN